VLATGERVAITLEFADGTRQGIEFEVRDTR
jgi:copper(I)-binding protein